MATEHIPEPLLSASPRTPSWRDENSGVPSSGKRIVRTRAEGENHMAMYDRFALSPEPDDVSVQDRDLLIRMSAYLDTIEMRIRQGQGWFIFNADRARAARIAQYVLAGLRAHAPIISHTLMTWRDFALNAYITEVALPREEQEEPAPEPESRRDQEQRIARRVSREAYWRALNMDVLILL